VIEDVTDKREYYNSNLAKKEMNMQSKETNKLSSEDIKQIMDKEFAGIDENDTERKQRALERALTLIAMEEAIRNPSECPHSHHEDDLPMSSENGHLICPVCGYDWGSPWDC
jgi:rubrerythrin